MKIDYKTFVRFLNEHFAEDDDKDTFDEQDEKTKQHWKKFLDYFKNNDKTLRGNKLNIGDEPYHEGSNFLMFIVRDDILKLDEESDDEK